MPTKEITRNEYYRRIGLVLDYIYANLDADLSLEKLAEVACLSTFHWHRIYQSITNESVTNTIRRLRLQRAARALVETDTCVYRIAQNAGYTHTDSFSRKFSQDFGVTPIQYRKQNALLFTENPYQPKLEVMPALELAALDHRGDYLTMGVTFQRLYLLGVRQGFLTGGNRTLGIFYSDPSLVDVKDLQSKACYTLTTSNCPGADVEHIKLMTQTYVSIVHQGPHLELDAAHRWLYGQWLLDSGYEPADKPMLEEYLNSPRTVAPRELLTKIYLPINLDHNNLTKE